MIGLVIASHGHLAAELLATAEQILGKLSQVETCSVDPGVSSEELRGQLREAVSRVDTGDGVIVFADLVGGSPCNQSLSLCSQKRLEVVTGVNLPMLLKANSLRASEHSLTDVAHALTECGRRSIMCATDAVRRHAVSAAG